VKGDPAPLAYPSVRTFPDWYHPSSINYIDNGYFMALLGIICLCKQTIIPLSSILNKCLLMFKFIQFVVGYSYMKDIKEVKGRKKRLKFFNTHNAPLDNSKNQHLHCLNRIKAGDPEYTKFLTPPAHH
jgi:hypothetical protein